jgi:hypothetical protein
MTFTASAFHRCIAHLLPRSRSTTPWSQASLAPRTASTCVSHKTRIEYNEVESTPAEGTSPEAPGGPAEGDDGAGPEETDNIGDHD